MSWRGMKFIVGIEVVGRVRRFVRSNVWQNAEGRVVGPGWV